MRAGRINRAVVYATIGLGWLHVPSALQGQINSWTNTSSGIWHVPANWSLGVAPDSTQSGIVLSNSSTKLVTVDATSASQFPSTLTIRKLWISAPSGFENALQLQDTGLSTPLRILGGVRIQRGGALFVANAALQVDGSLTDDGGLGIAGGVANVERFLTVGSVRGATGSVWVNGGMLAVANAPTFIGRSGDGELTVSNGIVVARLANVGGFQDSHGTLTVAGGTVSLGGRLAIGNARGSRGAVWVTGGELQVTNASTMIGNFGNGQLTVSNVTVALRRATVGGFGRSSGSMTVARSTVTIAETLDVGRGLLTHGDTKVDGGALIVTNAATRIGINGAGQMTLSDGTFSAQSVDIGLSLFGRGTITVDGGTMSVQRGMTIASGSGSAATLWVTGGSVRLTDYRANIFEFNPSLTVGAGGTGQISVSNGSFYAESASLNRGTFTVAGGTTMISNGLAVTEGNVWVSGGEFLPVSVGLFSAQMTVSNGTVRTGGIGLSSSGTLTLLGGQSMVFSLTALGATDAVPAIWVKGGELQVFENIRLGDLDVGTMTISNGVVTTAGLGVYTGTLTLAGGTLNVEGLTINQTANAFWMTGGTLNASTGRVDLAFNGFGGRWIISNGTAFIQSTVVGAGAEITQVGGVLDYGQELILTDVGAGVPAVYLLNGGLLRLTNGVVRIAGIGAGELAVNGGSMLANTLELGTDGILSINGGAVECQTINLGGGMLLLHGGTLECTGNVIISPSAVTRIALRDYGAVSFNVAGSVGLAGELRIELDDSFQTVVTNGSSFLLLSAGSVSGVFGNALNGIRLQTDDGVGSFLVTYDATTVRLTDFHRVP